MPRPRKDNKPLNIRLDAQLYDVLEEYAEVKGQTKTMAVERCLKEAFIKEGFMKDDNKKDSSSKD